MGLRIATWNVGRGFDVEADAQTIRHSVSQLDADIIICPELASLGLHANTTIIASDLGYESVIATTYQDTLSPLQTEADRSEAIFAVLSRIAIQGAVIRLGDIRNNLLFEVTERGPCRGLLFAAVHFDHRLEERREAMIHDLINSYNPDVITGDYNAMHKSDIRARILRSRSFKRVACTSSVWTPEQLQVANLAISMANGKVLSIAESRGYQDANRFRQLGRATMKLGRIPVLQLDRTMYKSDIPYSVSSHRYSLPGSDHLPVLTTISSTIG